METRRQLSVASALAVTLLLADAPAFAQVVNDGTLGTNGPGLVTNAPILDGGGMPIGTAYTLGEGDGELVGGQSLFFSLQQLDLLSGDELGITGRPSIENVVTRITGGASSIDGLIRSEILGADLFFLNPDGIAFGENARLDVSGSVVFSTAHEVALGDTGRFDARGMGGDILTLDPPETFGFLAPPAPIVISASQLIGADDEGLAFIGGDLDFAGRPGREGLIAVRSGRIDLASLASSGTVTRVLDPDAPNLVVSPGAARGTINLRDNFVVSTSGIATNPFDEILPVPGAGPLFVRARNLVLDESTIRTLTVSDTGGGDISIDLTGDLELRGQPGGTGSSISSGSDLDIEVPPQPPGVTPQTVSFVRPGFEFDLTTCDGVRCGIRYYSGGPAGNIDIRAHDVRILDGSSITSRSRAGGDAGTITLDLGRDLTIAGRIGPELISRISGNASGSGTTGTIRLLLPNGTLRMDDFGAILIENGDGSIVGDTPGRIEIDAFDLDMSGNARIDSSTRGEGTGGDIVIDVANRARLSGASGGGDFTGITSLGRSGSRGPAGTISLSAKRVEITDGAEIAARPEDDTAVGDAGSIRIAVADDLILARGTISTSSLVAAGGNVEISAGRVVELVDSAITTSVIEGDAPGGNIRIEPGPVVTRLERSEIIAQAVDGDGGSIFIQTNLLLADEASTIDASSTFGRDGTAIIESPEGEINVQQPELPTPPIDVSRLLREPCAARDPGAASSLVFEPDAGPVVPDRESALGDVSTLVAPTNAGTRSRGALTAPRDRRDGPCDPPR